MSDLISRATLLKALRKEQRECEKDGEEFGGESILFAEAFGDVIDMVKRLPAVDAVEVVRCKDCKRRGTSYKCPFRHIDYTEAEGYHYVDCTTFEGYCSFGERKDTDA